MIELNDGGEKTRKYHYDPITLKGVTHFEAGKTTDRLRADATSGEGKRLFIVNRNWNAVEIEADEFTV